ncbi:uncharacterized protein LOC123534264 [Mercenaria mercenaria]|uniref:uncharacterized protein LOC123534264 n=1 Tax=Mercenaria mercenaria TaxID=6596 RepID=UPI00234FB355|nr:uncharacterized protein LOC123534264 [Mercenaria mercenaria]
MTLDYVYLEVIVAVVFLPLFARGFLLNGNITTNSPDFQRNPTVAAVAPTKNVPVTLYVNISSTSSLVCEDTIDTCSQYGRTPCTEKTYEAWAKSHCALYCGLCTPPISANQLCENKLSNCAEFDSGNLCTDDRYYTWAYDNCKGYCKFDICNDSWCDDSKGVNCPLLDSAINLCSFQKLKASVESTAIFVMSLTESGVHGVLGTTVMSHAGMERKYEQDNALVRSLKMEASIVFETLKRQQHVH